MYKLSHLPKWPVVVSVGMLVVGLVLTIPLATLAEFGKNLGFILIGSSLGVVIAAFIVQRITDNIAETPPRRVLRLLNNTEKWQKVESDKYIYHEDYPEFTITDGEVLNPNFSEPWTIKFPDQQASMFVVDLRYGSTMLKRFTFVYCDGFRYRIPLPRRVEGRFEINANSAAWRVARIYDQYSPLCNALHVADISLIDGPSEDS